MEINNSVFQITPSFFTVKYLVNTFLNNFNQIRNSNEYFLII